MPASPASCRYRRCVRHMNRSSRSPSMPTNPAMSANPILTPPLRRRSTSLPRRAAPWPDSPPKLGAETLRAVREPLKWRLDPDQPASRDQIAAAIGLAARGPACDTWSPPSWLLPHQVDGAQRIAGSLLAFRGALLADATGLGKTYVALSVATRYRAP